MDECEHRRGLLPRRLIRRFAQRIAETLDVRISQIAALWRHEAHRLIALLTLSLAAACFIFTAVSLAVLGMILALWETHRVLSFVLAAGIFAAFAITALLLVARNLRSASPASLDKCR